ncbi:hypothetical protein [Porphyromonas macacae]|uniref:hypothetical protein n=1 Tax=Porphyromonas macacae TaxID=28115 RepID=UPI0035A03D37
MVLEVLHQQAETHENEQFRRVVKIMDVVFNKHKFNGILVGNPFNENYRRFRADAILFYNHGVVIIDFKDYSGQLILPRGDDEFKSYPWYAEKASDHQAIEVKAGAHFLNPFLQLASYRNAFREIVEHNLILKQKINPSRVCIANIFSGPLELTNRVPGKYPYYKIAQESEIGALLYDLNNDNAYDEDIEKAVRSIFPADEYVQEYTVDTEIIHKKDIIVGEEAKTTIDAFMQAEGNDILVLASMDASERDNWAKYLFSIADNYETPEVQGLCHSNRISRRLRSRGIEATSLYSFIYGGNEKTDNNQEDEDKDDWAVQVIPLRSDSVLDERALLIVYDAHLVSRSLSQTDLLRFGSGRLLEDFITFADPSSKRKVVFIGDPYMLSFGSSDDSAINIANLKGICGERVIHYYHQPVIDSQESCKEALKCSLAQSIDAQLFNKLSYSFDDGSIVEIEKDEIVEKMKVWFNSPFLQEPPKAVLFFKKGDCLKTNLWIKNHCLNNGKDLASGDLIIANNNIFIPNETGFGNPKRILNGMYFTVKEIREHLSEEIPIKGFPRPVLLSFTKISVNCLSLSGQSAEIWVLDNFLSSIDELAKEEQIAVNVFIERRIVELKKNTPFTDSEYYRQLMDDSGYQALSGEERSAIEVLIHNRIVKKEERTQVTTTRTARSLLKRFYDKYESAIQRQARENDSLINALYAKYAWAITVHKAVGSDFDNVILKGFRAENDGVCNESYFRWLYSGISTSTGTFFIAQPQYVHPFMNCIISETDSGVSTSKQVLVFDSYAIPPRFAEIIKLKNTNAAAAICELAMIIEPHGCILEEVKPCSDYLTKAIFSIPQGIKKKLIVDIHNKGEKDEFGVSAIKMEPNDLVDSNVIKKAIESVLSLNPVRIGTTESPGYISEVVLSFMEQIKERGINLEIVSSKDFQINCKASSENGGAMLRLWYGTSLENHTKGFINKIEVFDISDPNIITEIRNLRTLNGQ